MITRPRMIEYEAVSHGGGRLARGGGSPAACGTIAPATYKYKGMGVYEREKTVIMEGDCV